MLDQLYEYIKDKPYKHYDLALCLAGHACKMLGNYTGGPIMSWAQRELGLSDSEAWYLFLNFVGPWKKEDIQARLMKVIQSHRRCKLRAYLAVVPVYDHSTVFGSFEQYNEFERTGAIPDEVCGCATGHAIKLFGLKPEQWAADYLGLDERRSRYLFHRFDLPHERQDILARLDKIIKELDYELHGGYRLVHGTDAGVASGSSD